MGHAAQETARTSCTCLAAFRSALSTCYQYAIYIGHCFQLGKGASFQLRSLDLPSCIPIGQSLQLLDLPSIVICNGQLKLVQTNGTLLWLKS